MSMDIVIPIFSSSEDEEESSPAEESNEKKQQLNIKIDKKIKIPTPTASISARSTATDSNHEAIVMKRVWLLKQNPFEAEYGIRLETYSCFAVQIRQKAAVDGLLEIIDTKWLKKCIGQLTRKEDELEELLSIQNYLLRLAQSSAYEEQMKKKSDRMRILRQYQIRIKVDELDQNLSKVKLEPKEECQDYSYDGRSRSRKRSFTERDFKIKKEENNEDRKPLVKFEVDDDDEEEDRYYRKPFDTSNADIFKDSSPEPEPEMKPFDPEEGAQHRRRHHIDIERRPPRRHGRPESPEGPTARAQIVQRVFGAHVMPMPANLQRKNGGGDRKKRSARPKASLGDKLARAKTVSANNVYPEMEARSSTSESGSDDDEEESGDDDDDADLPPIHNSTIRVISSSSAWPNRKSCLKSPHRARLALMDEHRRRVHFAAGIEDNEGKSATIPDYVNQITSTKRGQASTTFTFSMPPVLTSQENVMGQPGKKWAPSSDHPIPIPIRDHPNNFKQADINVHMNEIYVQLLDALRIELSWLSRNSRLFLMDSLMTRMDKDMFKNMACIELNFPKMPMWFVDALDDWWVNQAQCQFFFYTKIFILLGMDLQLYFAHEDGRPEDTIYKFLTALNNWFDNKLSVVERSLQRLGEGSSHMVDFDMPSTDLQDRPCIVERMLPRLNQKPELIVLTVPEMGSWKPFFINLNKGLRKFVEENSPHFKLLDWAKLLGGMKAEEVRTVEQRTAVLIRQMHLEHALLYW